MGRKVLFVAWVSFCFLMAGSSLVTAQDREGWPKNMIIAGTSLGGSNYIAAAAWGDMLRKHLNIPATATTSGGTVMSIRLMEKGDIHMATCTGDTVFQAYRGLAPWDGKKDVSAIIWAHPVAWHWAVKGGKGYKNVKDIFSKATMQAHPWPASPTSELVFIAFGESVGFSLEKVRSRVKPLVSASDQVKNLRDGRVDAVMYGGAPETPHWIALSHEIDIEFIGPSNDEITWIHDKYPYFENIEVPAGMYKGQDKPLNTLAHRMGMVLLAKTPESFVYSMTKTMFDNMDELHKYHETYIKRWYTFQYLMDFLDVCPLHPGTVKYLKEKGKWTPQMEAKQRKQVDLGDYPSRMPPSAGWKQWAK
jgi:uncharacterized protein